MKGPSEVPHFKVDKEFRSFIENLIDALSKEPDHEKHIDVLLDAAVEFYKADRAYVIEGDVAPVCAINTHERTAPGKPLQQDTLKDLPTSAYVRWGEMFMRQETVIIENMEDIRDTYPGEYQYFSDSDVHGILVVPYSRQLCRGFIGIDNPRRYKTDALPLRVMTHIMAEELTEVKLSDENAALLGVSQLPEKQVQVQLFDHLEITARGGKLSSKALSGRGKTALALMLLNPSVRFNSLELHDIVSAEEHDPEKQSVVVSNAIYKIRSKLDTIGLKDLIVTDDGMYYINPDFNIDSDVQKFQQFCRDMRLETDEDEKLKIAEKALGLYVGSLPSSFCDSIRFETEAMDLDMKFLDMSKWSAELYLSRGEFERAYEVVFHAHRVDPEDGEMLLLMVRIKKAGRVPGIKTYAKKIRRFLNDEECAELDEILK